MNYQENKYTNDHKNNYHENHHKENGTEKAGQTAEPKNINPLNASNVFSDVLGSYTGVAEGGGPPTQDADDL
ncbi:MAG: hypothetical protein LBV33_01445 [Lachnospiraceae bacterium]|jgi:archaellum component FlaC|nr:hypothetical protein [Lachnospiraceae bacterium]